MIARILVQLDMVAKLCFGCEGCYYNLGSDGRELLVGAVYLIQGIGFRV